VRDHRPTHLVHLLATPFAFPVTDPASVITIEEDLVLPRPRHLVPGLPLRELLGGFGPAEVRGHRGIAEQLLEERSVSLAPWLDPHDGSICPAGLSHAVQLATRLVYRSSSAFGPVKAVFQPVSDTAFASSTSVPSRAW
jgi:hypothetical protein